MGKRFTCTEKWDDPWFCDLKPLHKLFWIFICDRCDNAGIWNPNWPIAEAFIGAKLGALMDLLSPFNGRIKPLPSGKLWVVKFIEFQQKTISLNESNPAHKNIIHLLSREGITDYKEALSQCPFNAPSMDHDRGSQCPSGIGEGKGEGKVKEKVSDLELPFSSESFKAKWDLWITYRKDKGKPVGLISAKEAFAQFSIWGEDKSMIAISEAIRNGWQGIFEPKQNGNSRQPTNRRINQNEIPEAIPNEETVGDAS